MIAPVAAVLLSLFVILAKGGRKGFPFMIPRDRDPLIHIYDFDLNQDTIMSMAETASELANENGYDKHIQTLVSLYLEETLSLIREKNAEKKKKIHIECTLITEKEGMRLILRDSGSIFDLSDSNALPDSFRQYVVANMGLSH